MQYTIPIYNNVIQHPWVQKIRIAKKFCNNQMTHDRMCISTLDIGICFC